MSLSSDLERSILAELKTLLCNRKLRMKDLYEWSSGPVTPRAGEIAVDVKLYNTVWHCCVPESAEKRQSG